ncbi:MAG: acetyltransferase [Ichthyobacteriaceae bacterium]|nr:acetyltransferase [Ichthyobacteriaceae bacterium]
MLRRSKAITYDVPTFTPTKYIPVKISSEEKTKDDAVVIYGAGGHSKVVYDILKLMKVGVVRIFDDNVKEIEGHFVENTSLQKVKSDIIITIGDNKARKRISNSLKGSFATAIHPDSIIDSTSKIGEGTVIMAGAVVNASSKIGKHCIINTLSSVDHDCVIHDYVHISPGANLCGSVEVGEGTHIGAGTTVIQGMKIGKWVVIGAGAVVIKDVSDGDTIVGVPGKKIK